MCDFKINDKVRIKSYDDMVEQYGVDDEGNIQFNHVVFTPYMKYLCGKSAIVVDLIIGDDVEVILEFEDKKDNSTRWCYVAQMLEHID